MATAKVSQYLSGPGGPALTTYIALSALVSGELLNLSHGGPSGVVPDEISFECTARPTSGVGVCLVRERASDSTSNNTAAVRLIASDGVSSLDDGTVRVFFKFYNVV